MLESSIGNINPSLVTLCGPSSTYDHSTQRVESIKRIREVTGFDLRAAKGAADLVVSGTCATVPISTTYKGNATHALSEFFKV